MLSNRLKKALAMMELDGVESVPVQVSREELRQIMEALEGRKRGHYVCESSGYADGYPVLDNWYCSVCDCCFEEWEEKPTYNFCPSCGADLRSEQNATD